MTLTGVAILFAEMEHFDLCRKQKEERKHQRVVKKKRKLHTMSVIVSNKYHAAQSPSTGEQSRRVVVTIAAGGNEDSDGSHESEDEVSDPLVIPDSSRSMAPQPDSEVERNTIGCNLASRELRAEMSQNKDNLKTIVRRGHAIGHCDLESAMDWLINTDVRPGVGCRRKVLDAFFENEAAGTAFHIWQ